MQDMIPSTSSVMPSVQGTRTRQMIGTWFVLILVVALVGGSLVWMQWASQRGIVLGYPMPSVHLHVQDGIQRLGQPSQFSANATGRELTYSWDFGDRTYQPDASGPQVTHTYNSSGSYTVTVTVTDSVGHSRSDTSTVQVLPPPPVASFTFTYYYYGQIVFDASSSQADPSTSIQSYNWDFGDGTNPYTTSSPQVVYTYGNTGTYTVTLTVIDAIGQQSDAYTATVVIS